MTPTEAQKALKSGWHAGTRATDAVIREARTALGLEAPRIVASLYRPQPPFKISIGSDENECVSHQITDASDVSMIDVYGYSMFPEDGECPVSKDIALQVSRLLDNMFRIASPDIYQIEAAAIRAMQRLPLFVAQLSIVKRECARGELAAAMARMSLIRTALRVTLDEIDEALPGSALVPAP